MDNGQRPIVPNARRLTDNNKQFSLLICVYRRNLRAFIIFKLLLYENKSTILERSPVLRSDERMGAADRVGTDTARVCH